MPTTISGSASAEFHTALPVAEGGTGATASTGSGNVVLSASPTLTGTLGAALITSTTASGENKLTVKADAASQQASLSLQVQSGTPGQTVMYMGKVGATTNGQVGYNPTNDKMTFFTNNSEKMAIDSSGTVTLGTPLPASSGGTGNTSGGGKVLQVVSTSVTTLMSTTSTAWQTAMTLAITPTATSSRILIFMNAVVGAGGASATGQSVWRGGTQILGGAVVSGATSSSGPSAYGGSGDSNNNEQIAIQGIDSPSTTSSTTYYFKYRSPQGVIVRINDLGSAVRNQTYSQTAQSSITLMEIGA